MSTTNKVITTYAKSLFQNLTKSSSLKKEQPKENY